jgi:hypothetical protein
MNRRRFIECFSAAGLGSTLMPGALAAVAQDAETITIDMIQAVQKIARVSFTRDEQDRILNRLNAAGGYAAGFEWLRTANLGNSTQPAIVFNPVPPGTRRQGQHVDRRAFHLGRISRRDEAACGLPTRRV